MYPLFTTLPRKALLFAGLSICLIISHSCRKDKETEVVATNKWILDTMRIDYYWNREIPNNSSLNFNRSPDDFFKTLLSVKDRFSWIQNAKELKDELSGVIKTSGMEIGVAYFGETGNDMIASVRFVHPGTPAAAAGIKRGDLFTKVNGTFLTATSGGSVPALNPVFGNNPFTISLVKYDNGTLVNDRDVSLTPIEGYQERAIIKDSIYTTLSGKKVAYLFYNRFLRDQRVDLVNVFGKFKNAGAQELILDLRYNSGGDIGTSALLSALIYKNFNPQDIFLQFLYNSNFRDDIINFDDLLGPLFVNLVSQNRLGLDRVYILATGASASASELVINGLNPLMGASNVIHIGTTTVGKNASSYTIEVNPFNDKSRIEWGLQPIFALLANKDGFGDYSNGFTPGPSNEVREWQSLPWRPIADTQDPLIARALSLIDPATATASMRMSRTVQETFSARTDAAISDDPGNRVRPAHISEELREKLISK
jgi:carboxyl-terminal processing protease